jgi:hypothetical protein
VFLKPSTISLLQEWVRISGCDWLQNTIKIQAVHVLLESCAYGSHHHDTAKLHLLHAAASSAIGPTSEQETVEEEREGSGCVNAALTLPLAHYCHYCASPG